MARQALHGRGDYRWWQLITTRWSDNDTYGHVNNAIYYHWFDTTVNAWLIEARLLDVAHGNLIGLVVETRCTYARSVTYPQSVEIGVALERLGSASVAYRLGAFVVGNDAAAAQALFTHVYVDRDTRRPAPLPPTWRERLAVLG